MSFNHGYLNNIYDEAVTVNGDGTMEKQAHRPSNSGNENNNTTTGNGSP
jgi:hypothetical protein